MNDDWKQRAACHGKTHLFFPPHRERAIKQAIREAEALLVCASCTVRDECDEAARQQGGEFGIWAGQPEDHYARAL